MIRALALTSLDVRPGVVIVVGARCVTAARRRLPSWPDWQPYGVGAFDLDDDARQPLRSYTVEPTGVWQA